MSSRHPRFERRDPPPLRLTEDDLAIFRHLAEHRFLRSTHLVQLLKRPADKILRRLAALYHNRYLDRPLAQREHLPTVGGVPLVYALGPRATSIVGDVPGNRTIQRPYLAHALLIADFMIALEVALRRHRDIQFVRADALLEERLRAGPNAPRGWSLPATARAISPDKVFALDFAATGRRNYFLLEADRATMPVLRASPDISAFHQKLVTYQNAHARGHHRTYWGIPGFRVLTVTTSSERIESMLRSLDVISNGKGSNVFLFATVDATSDPLGCEWMTGKRTKVRLLP